MELGPYTVGQEPMGGRVRIPHFGGRKSPEGWAWGIPESLFDFWWGATQMLEVSFSWGGGTGMLGTLMEGTQALIPLWPRFRPPLPHFRAPPASGRGPLGQRP